MTTFRQISGQLVKSYTTNPDNPLEGQMWYNQTELKLKGVTALEAWSSGAPLITARQLLAGAGTQTAGLGFGGETTVVIANTEEYNGSGWTSGGNMGTARDNLAGCGLQTAGLAFGGNIPPVTAATEEYTDPVIGTVTLTTS